MKLSHLKTGMVIEFRNGRMGLVIKFENYYVCQYFSGGWDLLVDLISENLLGRYPSYDVKTIYAPQSFFCNKNFQDNVLRNKERIDRYKVVYSESEKTYKMDKLVEQLESKGIKLKDEDGNLLTAQEILEQMSEKQLFNNN